MTKAQVERYRNGTKAEKSQVLDALCQVTGWHRDHARKALRQGLAGPPPPRPPREPVYRYEQPVIDALVFCWSVLDGPTGKRLRPALPTLVPALLAHQELTCPPHVIDQLLGMSASTIDRRLAPYRTGLVATKGRSMTRPGSMLKSAIPMKTWHEWNDTQPGFLQIDLVGHDGGDANGAFHYTLDAKDVATGWTESITLRSKGERIVSAGPEQLRLAFPFAVLGIHSDNGSEFINHHLLHWCDTRAITFSRGRANHSNDQAHIEQKNWSEVRRAVGYHRYDTARELDLLNELWPLQSILDNLFLAQQKLLTKTRHGAKVTKTYDQGATPYTRLARDHPDAPNPHDRAALDARLAQTNPADLRRQISAIQATLIDLARRRGKVQQRPKTNATYPEQTQDALPQAGTRPRVNEANYPGILT